ncbi:hypothetical protein HY967_04775 [Candidatus Jorgensenbacteria bacterium]|nr:hypothetical protein [Candidatus Jorgensenbacteria bacterium]
MFGTCGGSTWRDRFMARYKELGIDYYNPQVENWDPSNAIEEARHLAQDPIILFPVTGESYGLGSLSEVGFSILQAIRIDDRRDFVVLIDDVLDLKLDNGALSKESMRARRLVKQHLKELRLPNLYIVNSLDEMLEVSVILHQAAMIRAPLAKFNPHRRVE